jgi:hypothetical protein
MLFAVACAVKLKFGGLTRVNATYVSPLAVKTIGRAFTVPLTTAGTSMFVAVTFATLPFNKLLITAVRALRGVSVGAVGVGVGEGVGEVFGVEGGVTCPEPEELFFAGGVGLGLVDF